MNPRHYVLIGLLAVFCHAAASAAKFTGDVRATSSTSSLSSNDETTRIGPAGLRLAAHTSITEQPGPDAVATGKADALAHILPGGLQLFAEAGSSSIVSSGQLVGGGMATASGSIDDKFTLLVPNCTNSLVCGAGRKGFVTFAMGVDGSNFFGSGSNTVDGPGEDGAGGLSGWSVSGSWSVDMRVNAGYIPGTVDPTSASYAGGQGRSQTHTSQPVLSGTGSFAMREFTVAFLFGRAIDVHLDGYVSASSGASAFVGSPPGFTTATGVSSFKTDLFHTISWGGIREVRDATGQPISGWTAHSSDTGFNYALPYVSAVPEPSPWVLMLAGMAVLALRRRALPADD
jgi:hypothetical protein